MTYLLFTLAWVQTRKDSNSYFDTDKLNGFINSSNNLPSLIYWILLFFLLVNGVIYIYKEVNLDMRLINLNLLVSSNLILIFGMLGGAYPVQNFFNYIIFGQTKEASTLYRLLMGILGEASLRVQNQLENFMRLFCFSIFYHYCLIKLKPQDIQYFY